MRSEDGAECIVEHLTSFGDIITMKVIGHTHISEESQGIRQVETSVSLASVNEEDSSYCSVSVSVEDTRGYKGKLRVGCDGLLDTMKPVFRCRSEVEHTTSKFITEVDELIKLGQSPKTLKLDTHYLIEQSLIETVVITKKEITYGTGLITKESKVSIINIPRVKLASPIGFYISIVYTTIPNTYTFEACVCVQSADGSRLRWIKPRQRAFPANTHQIRNGISVNEHGGIRNQGSGIVVHAKSYMYLSAL